MLTTPDSLCRLPTGVVTLHEYVPPSTKPTPASSSRSSPEGTVTKL